MRRGDVREDGQVFWCYSDKTHAKARFVSRETFIKRSERAKQYEQNRNLNTDPVFRIHAIAKKLRKDAVSRAKDRGGNCTITTEWIEDGIKKLLQRNLCILEKSRSKTRTAHALAPSLDRIDTGVADYTEANTRVVPWCLNQAKNVFSEDVFKSVAVPAILQFSGHSDSVKAVLTAWGCGDRS